MIYRGTITCSIGKNYVGETVPSHGSDRYGHRTLPAEFRVQWDAGKPGTLRNGTEQNGMGRNQNWK